MNHTGCRNGLADWERELLGSNLATLGVVFKDGNGDSFDRVDFDSVNYDEKTGLLSFEIANRCYFVPGVRYFTRQG